MKALHSLLLAAACFACSAAVFAASATVDIYQATLDGQGKKLGQVVIEESNYGLVFKPELKGLAPGLHGFHVHAKGDCGPGPDANTGQTIPAGAAGGHLDPKGTNAHKSPWEDTGHLGDLPALFVDAQGSATQPMVAPKLKSLSDIQGKALMIHEGGDNYADHPKALGGGGGRKACGVVR